jgi:hypothetical protein
MAPSVPALRLLAWHDFTHPHLRAFVDLMLKEMTAQCDHMVAGGVSREYIHKFQASLRQRLLDIDRGVFVWGMFVAVKSPTDAKSPNTT